MGRALAIGEDVTIGRYLTPETVRLGLHGVAVGLFAGIAWRVAGRTRWGWVPFPLAVFAAARLTSRSDWPEWDGMAAAGVFTLALAAMATCHLLADPAIDWKWVGAGSVLSAAGVWAGVPETGPAVLVGASLTGLAVAAALTRARWAPSSGLGVAAVLGWAALSGAAGRPWAAVGGALCAGIAPAFAFRRWLPTASFSRPPGLWLLAAHTVLVVLAARWVGVNPHAGWGRVAVLAAAGGVVAVATRSRA